MANLGKIVKEAIVARTRHFAEGNRVMPQSAIAAGDVGNHFVKVLMVR